MMLSLSPCLQLLLLLVLSLSLLPPSLSDDLSLLHSRLFASLSPTPTTLPSILSLTAQYSSHLNSSCYFTDVDYFDQSRDVWATADHMARLLTMSQALTYPSSPLYNDTTLSNHIHCALQVWISRGWTNPNWWWGVIGIPLDVTSIMLLLTTDRLSAAEVEGMSRISFQANWWTDDWGGGANLVWELTIQLYRSVTTRNTTGVEQGFSRMWTDVALAHITDNGIQLDWSYHFHTQQLMTGAYGAAWTEYILAFAIMAQDTQFALSDDRAELFTQFLVEGNAWMSIGGVWDFATVGRAVDRPGQAGPGLGYTSESVRGFAASAGNLSGVLLAYADRMDGLSSAAPLTGTRFFHTSDYFVHRRPSWIATLKLHSIRTIPTECDNSENLKGEHLGDGVLALYTSDAQRYRGEDYEDIFPLLDWQLINGVTCEVDVPLLECGESTGDVFKMRTTEFVGGVVAGRVGAATMDTATHNLTGHRSWFFLPDVVLALASNLTDPTQADVRTTLHSRLLPRATMPGGKLTVGWVNGTQSTVADGVHQWVAGQVRWLHAGGLGYVVDGDVAVGADVGQKTGNFDSIGPNNRSISKRMLTSWIDHGRGVKGAGYGYAVVPNVTADGMAAAVKGLAADVVCGDSTEVVHGLAVPRLRRAFVVVYPNGTSTARGVWACDEGGWPMTVTAPAGLYVVEEDDEAFTVTGANPVKGNKGAEVRVSRVGTGGNCTKDEADGTVVSLMWPSGDLLGASVSVRCVKAKPARISAESD